MMHPLVRNLKNDGSIYSCLLANSLGRQVRAVSNIILYHSQWVLLLLLPLFLQAQVSGTIKLENALQWETLADSLAETPALDSAIQIRQQLQHAYQEAEAWEAFAEGGLALANYYSYADNYDLMLTTTNEVIRTATPHLEEPSETLANAFQLKGEIFYYVYQQWDSSSVYLEKAIPAFTQLGLSDNLIYNLLLNTTNRVYLARWEEVLPDLAKAEAEMQQISLPIEDPQWGELYNFYGLTYRQLERHEEALRYQLQTINYTEPDYLFAAYLHNLADLYHDRADWNRATQYYDQALQMLRNSAEAELLEQEHILRNLCIIWIKNGDPLKAIDYGKQNLELLEKLDSPELIRKLIAASNNLALAYLEANQPDNALQLLKEAEALHQSEPYHQEFTWHNLSLAYRMLGRYEDAIRYMQQSISHYEETDQGDHPLMAKKFRHLGVIFATQGDFTKALTYYEEAFRLPAGNISNLDSLKLLRDRGLALMELAKTDSGETDYWAAASDNHLRAMGLADRLRQEYAEGSASLFAQDTFPVYERSADVAYFQYEAAADEAHLSHLFHIAERTRLAQAEESAIAALNAQVALLPDSLQRQFQDVDINRQFYRQQLQKAGETASEKQQYWQTTLAELDRQYATLLSHVPVAALAETTAAKQKPIRSLEGLQDYLTPDLLLVNLIRGEKQDYVLGIHKTKVVVEAVDKNRSPVMGLTKLIAPYANSGIQTLVLIAPAGPEKQELINTSFPGINILSLEQSELYHWLDGKE